MTVRTTTVTPKTLYVVATPIGNLEDITYRAVQVLKTVSCVAAEDTRRAQILFGRYDIHTPLVSYFEGNEQQRTPMLIDRLLGGDSIAVISEAGMPGICDPGAVIIQACHAQDIAIDIIPGPSAVLSSLVWSGIDAKTFSFWGFFPRGNKHRSQTIEKLRHKVDTTVFFESPQRITQTVTDLAESLPDRPAALVREITKHFAQCRRGSLRQLAEILQSNPVKGECCLVVAGSTEEGADSDASVPTTVTEEELISMIDELAAAGISTKRIAAILGPAYGRTRIYQLAIAHKA